MVRIRVFGIVPGAQISRGLEPLHQDHEAEDDLRSTRPRGCATSGQSNVPPRSASPIASSSAASSPAITESFSPTAQLSMRSNVLSPPVAPTKASAQSTTLVTARIANRSVMPAARSPKAENRLR